MGYVCGITPLYFFRSNKLVCSSLIACLVYHFAESLALSTPSPLFHHSSFFSLIFLTAFSIIFSFLGREKCLRGEAVGLCEVRSHFSIPFPIINLFSVIWKQTALSDSHPPPASLPIIRLSEIGKLYISYSRVY